MKNEKERKKKKKGNDLCSERTRRKFEWFPCPVKWESQCRSAPSDGIAAIERSCLPWPRAKLLERSADIKLKEAFRAIWPSVRWGLPQGLENTPEYLALRCCWSLTQGWIPCWTAFQSLLLLRSRLCWKGLLTWTLEGLGSHHSMQSTWTGGRIPLPTPTLPQGVQSWAGATKWSRSHPSQMTSPSTFFPLVMLTNPLFQAQMTTALQEPAGAASPCWRWAHKMLMLALAGGTWMCSGFVDVGTVHCSRPHLPLSRLTSLSVREGVFRPTVSLLRAPCWAVHPARVASQEDTSSSSIPLRVWPWSSSISDQESGMHKQTQALYAVSLPQEQRHCCWRPTLIATPPPCVGMGADPRTRLPLWHPAAQTPPNSSPRPQCCFPTSSFLWPLQRQGHRNSPQGFQDSAFPSAAQKPGLETYIPLSYCSLQNTVSRPQGGLFLRRAAPCCVCSSPPFPFCLLALKNQVIMESSRAEDTKSQKHLAEAT